MKLDIKAILEAYHNIRLEHTRTIVYAVFSIPKYAVRNKCEYLKAKLTTPEHIEATLKDWAVPNNAYQELNRINWDALQDSYRPANYGKGKLKLIEVADEESSL